MEESGTIPRVFNRCEASYTEDTMKRTRTIILIAIAVAVIASAAFANGAWSKLFNSTYKPKAGSALANAKCQVCHTMKVPALNPYGTALKGKPMTAASLKAIERLDSDKDKFSNIAEIKAGTLPGDPKSKPAKKK